ncbi:MAG: iron-containing alcohol dehydrogenase [Candidatus Thorarchaeota archaeon]|nr:MAG: iron-containing alcohol dehydrogenase [Candidatus Thorarchaeota archaeon]
MSWQFDIPRVIFGEDSIEELELLAGESAFIITDTVINKLGIVDRVTQILADNQWSVAVWDCAEPDPRISTVRQAAEGIRNFGADTILAIGGGSVMDTAKAAWVLYAKPDMDLTALTPFDELGVREKAKLVCIPTTAGTGSEVTRAIVIREDETGRKFATINPELTPDIAILEPVFVKDLPKNLTAYTGMDALTHAVEGYVSSWKNDISDGCSMKAVKMIFEWLPKSVENPEDLVAREKMLVAASLAGMAFGNAQAALAHSLGHSMGSVLRLQHGLSVGMALPYTIEYSCKGEPDAARHYSELASLIGISGKRHEHVSRKFAQAIRELMERIGSPTNMKAAKVTKKAFKASIDKLVQYAMMDAAISMNPRNTDSGIIRRIYEYMFEGNPVDF